MKKILGIVAGVVGIISVIVGVALKMNNNAIALTLPTAKAGGFLLQPLLHWLIPFGISMSYTVSTS